MLSFIAAIYIRFRQMKLASKKLRRKDVCVLCAFFLNIVGNHLTLPKE